MVLGITLWGCHTQRTLTEDGETVSRDLVIKRPLKNVVGNSQRGTGVLYSETGSTRPMRIESGRWDDFVEIRRLTQSLPRTKRGGP